MKCSKCGYVSFDDVDVCKGCGAVIEADESPERGEETPLQDELFAADGEEEAGKDSGGANGAEEALESTFMFDEAPEKPPAHAVELPDMSIDYDPADEEVPPPPHEGRHPWRQLFLHRWTG